MRVLPVLVLTCWGGAAGGYLQGGGGAVVPIQPGVCGGGHQLPGPWGPEAGVGEGRGRGGIGAAAVCSSTGGQGGGFAVTLTHRGNESTAAHTRAAPCRSPTSHLPPARGGFAPSVSPCTPFAFPHPGVARPCPGASKPPGIQAGSIAAWHCCLTLMLGRPPRHAQHAQHAYLRPQCTAA